VKAFVLSRHNTYVAKPLVSQYNYMREGLNRIPTVKM